MIILLESWVRAWTGLSLFDVMKSRFSISPMEPLGVPDGPTVETIESGRNEYLVLSCEGWSPIVAERTHKHNGSGWHLQNGVVIWSPGRPAQTDENLGNSYGPIADALLRIILMR